MPVVLPSASSGQRRRPEWSDLAAQYRAHACPCRTLRRRRCRRRCMTRGRRGSLRLRRLALSSFPFCRFIPAHPDLLTYPSAELSGSRGATAGRMRSRGLGKRSAGAPVCALWRSGDQPAQPSRTGQGQVRTRASSGMPPAPAWPVGHRVANRVVHARQAGDTHHAMPVLRPHEHRASIAIASAGVDSWEQLTSRRSSPGTRRRSPAPQTDRVGSWPARGRCPCPRRGARIIQELWSLEQPDG
jgi:hypothetical protein